MTSQGISNFSHSILLFTDEEGGTLPSLPSIANGCADNIIINDASFTSLSTASQNIILGNSSASSINTGSNNVIIGDTSATSIQGGSSNVVIGDNAATEITVDTGILGEQASPPATTTQFVLEVGKSTNDDAYIGYTLTFTSGGNIGLSAVITDYVGATRTVTVGSGFSSLPAENNTYTIKVGTALVAGSQNTLIGCKSTCGGAFSNQTSLGYLSVCTAANQVTLGNNDITALRCADTTIATLSDARDKTNVSNSTYGLDFVNTLRPVQYTWNRRNLEYGDSTSIYNGKTRVGFLAQELQSAMPNNENEILDLVYEANPERLEAKYGNLIPILTKAIQDLSAANTALAARVSALESA